MTIVRLLRTTSLFAALAVAACSPAPSGDTDEAVEVATPAPTAAEAETHNTQSPVVPDGGAVRGDAATIARIDKECRASIETQLTDPASAVITLGDSKVGDGREATVVTKTDGVESTNTFVCNIQGDGTVKADLNAG